MERLKKFTWHDGYKIINLVLIISCFCFGGTILMYAYTGTDGHTGAALILGITLFLSMLIFQGDFLELIEEEDDEYKILDENIENGKIT